MDTLKAVVSLFPGERFGRKKVTSIARLACAMVFGLCLFGCHTDDKLAGQKTGDKPQINVGSECSYDEFAGNCFVYSVDVGEDVSYFKFSGTVDGKKVEFNDNKADGLLPLGKYASCTLKKIKTGTCTPCLIQGKPVGGSCGKEGYSFLFQK